MPRGARVARVTRARPLRRALAAIACSVAVTIPTASGLASPSAAGASTPSTARCAAAVQSVFLALLRGGSSWRTALRDSHPLEAGGGAPTALVALAQIARVSGLVPACPIITVSYAAQALDLLLVFGGPGTQAHLRAMWDKMTPTQRRALEKRMDEGQGPPPNATIRAHRLLATHGAFQEWHIVIFERQGSSSGTTSETLTLERVAGRWYAAFFASLGANFG